MKVQLIEPVKLWINVACIYVDSGAEKEIIRTASTYLDSVIVPFIQLKI